MAAVLSRFPETEQKYGPGPFQDAGPRHAERGLWHFGFALTQNLNLFRSNSDTYVLSENPKRVQATFCRETSGTMPSAKQTSRVMVGRFRV